MSNVRVDCDLRKWPDLPHWRFGADLIERDGFGTWLSCLPPTPYTGPRVGDFEHAFVLLVPPDDWWIASFNDDRVDDAIYVDIATPATWRTEHHVTAVDLDLDIVRFHDGRVELVDEDEFAEHQVAFGYPDDVIAQARSTADRMFEIVQDDTERFLGAGRERLERLLQLPYDAFRHA